MNCAPENTPPCRCEFVQRWLDAHEKYFTKTSLTPKQGYTQVAHRTYGPSQVHYGFAGNIQYSPKAVQLPYVMQPPYRISPMPPPKP
ncbi:unnamed protein product [Colias eurytheme]|nr:unnamed protein product [Colias eurytheme]